MLRRNRHLNRADTVSSYWSAAHSNQPHLDFFYGTLRFAETFAAAAVSVISSPIAKDCGHSTERRVGFRDGHQFLAFRGRNARSRPRLEFGEGYVEITCPFRNRRRERDAGCLAFHAGLFESAKGGWHGADRFALRRSKPFRSAACPQPDHGENTCAR